MVMSGQSFVELVEYQILEFLCATPQARIRHYPVFDKDGQNPIEPASRLRRQMQEPLRRYPLWARKVLTKTSRCFASCSAGDNRITPDVPFQHRCGKVWQGHSELFVAGTGNTPCAPAPCVCAARNHRPRPWQVRRQARVICLALRRPLLRDTLLYSILCAEGKGYHLVFSGGDTFAIGADLIECGVCLSQT